MARSSAPPHRPHSALSPIAGPPTRRRLQRLASAAAPPASAPPASASPPALASSPLAARVTGGRTSLLDLVQWALGNSVKYSTIRPAELNGARGVVATFPVAAGRRPAAATRPPAPSAPPAPALSRGPPPPRAGQALVSVPRSTALSTFPGEPCPFAQQLPEASWQQLPWYGKLAAKLLAEAAQGGASRLSTFVQLLPPAVELPALWSREQLQQLHNPALAQKARRRCWLCAHAGSCTQPPTCWLGRPSAVQQAGLTPGARAPAAQVEAEQAEWARCHGLLKPLLASMGLTGADLDWALCCVSSRSFAGPYAGTPLRNRLIGAAALQAAAAAVALAVHSTAAAAALDVAGLAALAAWTARDFQQAASLQLHAMCPLIDLFNHSSSSSSGCEFNIGELKTKRGVVLWPRLPPLQPPGSQPSHASAPRLQRRTASG
jgi:hypothetical protein